VAAIGGMSFSIPIELTDLRRSKMDGKICNQPNCDFAGVPQPLENFNKVKSMISRPNPEGIAARCKVCNAKASKASYQKRKSDPPPVITKSKLRIPKKKKKTAGNGHLNVLLDVSDYPELMEKISSKARQQFRDLPHQILYELQSIMGMEQ
jgi:hypothetical protein